MNVVTVGVPERARPVGANGGFVAGNVTDIVEGLDVNMYEPAVKTVRTVTVCVVPAVKPVNVAVVDVVVADVPVPNIYVYETVKGVPAGDKDSVGRVAAVHDTWNPVGVNELGTIAKPVGATGASWILIGAVAAEVSAEEVLSYLEYTERL